MMLTPRQREVLHFIRSVELDRGTGPTTREIQERFGFASQTAAVDHIRALERKGALSKTAGKARAVTTSPPRVKFAHVPIYGSVPAGLPENLDQEADGFVPVDLIAAGLSDRAKLFATKVRGDSMINASILDGDIAVFEVRDPSPGQIVAALIDGETTLKRYVRERGKVFLHAENPKYPDLLPARELVIQGVLVHLQRNALPSQHPAARSSPAL
ncbi:MAG TPA: transcriptional repressor LexA [Chthoniobacteraceae bacterium]